MSFIYPAHIRHFALVTTCLAALSACGGGGGGGSPAPIPPTPAPTLPAGADRGGAGAPGDSLAAFTANTTFTPVYAQGLEVATYANGGFRLQTEAESPMQLARTTTGFDMSYSRANSFGSSNSSIIQYDTRPGSSHRSDPTNYAAPPGVNEYQSCTNPACLGAQGGPPRVRVQFNSGTSGALTYSTYGIWTQNDFAGGVVAAGAFAVGQPSTVQQVPTTGTALFTGSAAGVVGTNFQDSVKFRGAAELNVDFGARTVNGSITAITAERIRAPVQNGNIGNITLAGGTISGASFTGTATGTTQLGTTLDIGGSTGRFGGQFYGPNAQEAAGSFSLTKPDMVIIGSFGVKR